MPEQGILRSRLRESHPVLYGYLQCSWKVALDSWLHAIDVNMGSSNSYPHLRNVENHLDHVIVGFEEASGTGFDQKLSPLEIYLLLSGVLFHDIGRAQPSKEGHGKSTEDLVAEYFAHLGIPSKELARAIGGICARHCPPTGKGWTKTRRKLSTTVIDPYGEAREQLLAALLRLADCMDAAYTRAVPEYLTDSSEEPVGLFRRSIRGVYLDPFARLIRTVLVPEQSDSQKPKRTARYTVALNTKRKKDWVALLGNKGLNTFLTESQTRRNLRDLENLLQTELGPVLGSERRSSKPAVSHLQGLWSWNKSPARGAKPDTLLADISERTPLLHWLLALDLFRLVKAESSQRVSRGAGSVLLPAKATLAIILGNMRENCEILAEITEPLATSGILVAAWLIERKEHLYNHRGCETFEPLFHKEYLLEVARGMWDLSCQVFGTSRFSYQELASHVGDPSIERVKRAVRRIAILAAQLPLPGLGADERDGEGAVWAGTTRWEWRVVRREGRCHFVPFKDVEPFLQRLEAPDEQYGTSIGQ